MTTLIICLLLHFTIVRLSRERFFMAMTCDFTIRCKEHGLEIADCIEVLHGLYEMID